MDDAFTELVVSKRPGSREKGGKLALIFLTVITGAVGIIVNPLFLVLFVGCLIADYFLFPRFKVELEYSYVNGTVDIAAVYSKSSRRELASINLEEAECIAPASSHHLDSYGATYKVVDYSANDPDQLPYAVVVGGQNERKILLQLSDKMLNDLRYRIPGRVFSD